MDEYMLFSWRLCEAAGGWGDFKGFFHSIQCAKAAVGKKVAAEIVNIRTGKLVCQIYGNGEWSENSPDSFIDDNSVVVSGQQSLTVNRTMLTVLDHVDTFFW